MNLQADNCLSFSINVSIKRTSKKCYPQNYKQIFSRIRFLHKKKAFAKCLNSVIMLNQGKWSYSLIPITPRLNLTRRGAPVRVPTIN